VSNDTSDVKLLIIIRGIIELFEVVKDLASLKSLHAQIRNEMGKQNLQFYIELLCIIHQQSLCGKILRCEDVMKFMMSVVNFIQSDGHIHLQFPSFFCQKFMFNMETSCTIKKSDG